MKYGIFLLLKANSRDTANRTKPKTRSTLQNHVNNNTFLRLSSISSNYRNEKLSRQEDFYVDVKRELKRQVRSSDITVFELEITTIRPVLGTLILLWSSDS